MELISNLALGFSVSLHPINLLFGFAGVALGVIIGILPGLGSAATIALLLPITYFLDTTTAVIMLAVIWYGSMYGGSITSILLRVPGESASVMVAIDGHELTKQGRAGAALGMSIFSAFIAGMSVGRSDYSLRAATDALPMRDAFAVLFFVSIGMLLDPVELLSAPWLVVAALGIERHGWWSRRSASSWSPSRSWPPSSWR